MLIISAADAAYTLADAYGPGLPAFVGKMNVEAAKLGLAHTRFTSPDGLPYPTEADAAGHTLLFEAVRGDRALTGDVLGSPRSGPGAGARDAAKILTWGCSLKQAR